MHVKQNNSEGQASFGQQAGMPSLLNGKDDLYAGENDLTRTKGRVGMARLRGTHRTTAYVGYGQFMKPDRQTLEFRMS